MSQQQKQDIQILQPVLKELPQGISVKHIKSLTVSNNSENVKSTRVLRSVQPLGISNVELFKKLKEQAASLGEDIEQDNKDQINTLLQTLTPKYSLGAQLQNVEGVERIQFGEEESFTKEDSTFSIENGIVYLVDIWATWCGPCQLPMEHNQKMLEKNPDWAGKAKIVGISVDDATEDVTKRVNSKKWKSIEHYRFLKGWDDENDLIRYLQLRGIPFVLVINKWGKIVYMGHPSKGALETRIAEEIKAEQDTAGNAQGNGDEKQPEAEELLTKEDYKQLKLSTQTLKTALKEAAIEGIVTISLEKINVWKPDGSKEVLKRSKLVLSYDVDVSQEEKLTAFLEKHWNTIPEALRRVKEAKIRDPIRQKKEIQTKFQETFSGLGVNISYSNQETTTFSYNAKKAEISSDSTSGFFVQAENLTAELYKEGMEKLKDYLTTFEEDEEDEVNGLVLNTITTGLRQFITLGEGKQFETIENYKKWGTEEYTKIEHTQGQVLLLDYWAKWCGPCVKEIEKNTKLLKENQETWGNNVKVVSLSLVLAEDAKEYMDAHEESQKYIDFYFPKEQKQPDTQKYGVQYIPHYVVVDKFGTIRQIASVENVHDLVTKLLGEQAPQEKEGNNAQQIAQDSLVKLKGALVSEETNKAFAEFDKQHLTSFELTITSKTIGDKVTIEKPSLSYFIRDTQVPQFSVVLQKVFEIIPEHSWNISKKISKTISVQYPGKVCAVCQKDISEEVQQYYSPFKSEHVCCECAEADDQTKVGIQRFKYLDTLIFINGPLADLQVLKDIDDHKIGTNQKLKEGDAGSQQHPMMCNGCGGGSVGPRYISLSARPGKYRGGGYIDYCSQCFAVLKDKNSEKAKEIVAKDVEDGMVIDSLYTRVLFNYGGYTEF